MALQAGGSFQSSTDANLATLVGSRFDLSDGREVILVSTSAATTTTAGQLYQDEAIDAQNVGMAVTAFQAYSNNGNTPATVTVTIGSTALVVNHFQGGFAVISEGVGLGQTLKIASHPAALASATGVVLTLEDGPNVALTTASKVCLIPAHGAGIIVNPTTATNVVAGIGLYPIAASSYGFIHTKGLVSALSDNKPVAVGSPVSPSVTTAGCTTLAVQSGTTGTLTSGIIGNAAYTAVSAKCMPIFLNV